MSDNKKMNDFKVYKWTDIEDIERGEYKFYEVEYQHNYYKSYILISVYKHSNFRNSFYRYYYINKANEIDDCLNKNKIKLEKLEIINEIKDDEMSKNVLICKINEPPICNNYLICNDENSYTKEFFIKTKKDKEEFKKYPVCIDIYYTDVHLSPKTHYNINNFELDKNNNIISIESSTFNTGKNYYGPKNDEYIYINNRTKDILKTYFKCENDKIYCIYNNKKKIAKLTFITHNILETADCRSILFQSLKLEIGEKKFTFYINNPKLIDYNKEGKYCFLVMRVRSNPYLLSNNLILGYEFNKDEYYYLKYEEKLILKNIDKEIAGKYINMKDQNIYTYLLSNNEKCGMTINIDKDHNVTYKLVKLNDKCFEKLIDISLLKPVSEWDKELYEINNINNKNEFDGVIEGFDN